MKYDLTSYLILFRPVMNVKYSNNYWVVFNFKQMWLFLICQEISALGGFEQYESLGDELLILYNPGNFFVGSCFCWNWITHWFLQIIRNTYKLCWKMSKWLFICDLGWKSIPCKLRNCGTNSGIIRSSET